MIALLSMFLIVLGVQSAAAEHTQSCEDRSYSVSNHFSLVCSATWQFDGVCDGTSDMWDRWKLSGRTVQPNDPFIRPWLDQDITVIGYELVKVKGSSDSWFMVGSAMQADAQMWLAPHETRSRQMWPSGLGQPWPARSKANHARLADMLDLHGWCPKGDSPVILLTIYYTPEWHSPPQDGTASAKNEDHHQIEPAAPKTDNQ